MSTEERTSVEEAPQSETPEAPKQKWKARCINDWVLIEKLEFKDYVTSGGVHIPKSMERSSRGIVRAASPKTDLKEGDLVIFTNFPIEVKDPEEMLGIENLKLVRYEEVYLVFEPCE